MTSFISNIQMRPPSNCCSVMLKWSLVCVCACCSPEPLPSCCCYFYHPSQEQIACQNKRSPFRPAGRQLSERMQSGWVFILFFYPLWNACKKSFWEGESQGSEKPDTKILLRLVFQAMMFLPVLKKKRKNDTHIHVMAQCSLNIQY